MSKIFKLIMVAVVIALFSVAYTFMMGYTWGTPDFGKCVSSSFGTGIIIAFLASIFLDVNFDD